MSTLGNVMLQVRSKDTLDQGDHGWLKARHHFAVTADGNPATEAHIAADLVTSIAESFALRSRIMESTASIAAMPS